MSGAILSPTLSRRLAAIIETLCKAVAAQGGRRRDAVPLILLAWPYLRRLAARFESLARRLQAGAVAPPLQSGAAAPPPRHRPARDVPPRGPRLPRRFGWLIRLAPETAQLGDQVRHFLADPEMAALLAADPRAGRLLRPLCRMLAITDTPDVPPALFHPPAPRRAPILGPPTLEPPILGSPALGLPGIPPPMLPPPRAPTWFVPPIAPPAGP